MTLFYCICNQINAALVRLWYFFQKKIVLTDSKPLNCSVYLYILSNLFNAKPYFFCLEALKILKSSLMPKLSIKIFKKCN